MFTQQLFGFIACASVALSIPTWEGFNTRESIGDLVPGASFIEALGPTRPGGDESQWRSPTYLFLPGTRGAPANATIGNHRASPPIFFINQDRLWNYVNSTTILPVNVVNSSSTISFPQVDGVSPTPYRLETGKKRQGSGRWKWQGTLLSYSEGKNETALYYSCQDKSGQKGVYLFLQPSATPAGCELTTLHSFNYKPGK